MQIAHTGFLGHLSGYCFFPSPRRGFDRLRRGCQAPARRLALDPEQFLDDLVNRFKCCEPALGDDAMRRTIGFFSIPFGFVCLAIFSPNRCIFSPGALPNQRNGPSDSVSGSGVISPRQQEVGPVSRDSGSARPPAGFTLAESATRSRAPAQFQKQDPALTAGVRRA